MIGVENTEEMPIDKQKWNNIVAAAMDYNNYAKDKKCI